MDSSYYEESDNSAEKIDVESEVHEECEERHEETVDVDQIAIPSTTEVQDSEVLKCTVCHNVPEVNEFSNLLRNEMEKFLKLPKFCQSRSF